MIHIKRPLPKRMMLISRTRIYKGRGAIRSSHPPHPLLRTDDVCFFHVTPGFVATRLHAEVWMHYPPAAWYPRSGSWPLLVRRLCAPSTTWPPCRWTRSTCCMCWLPTANARSAAGRLSWMTSCPPLVSSARCTTTPSITVGDGRTSVARAHTQSNKYRSGIVSRPHFTTVIEYERERLFLATKKKLKHAFKLEIIA